MIDQCINEVYKRDERVIIPNFGAIIHSEFSDEINFNIHLDFDDGKVVKAVQKLLVLSEEKAKDALEEYVQDIRKKLDKGKTIFIGGIGYFSKDNDGEIAIEKTKSPVEPKGKIQSSKGVSVKADANPEQIENTASQSETQKETVLSDSEESYLDMEDSIDQSVVDEKEESTFDYDEESDYLTNEMDPDDTELSDENEEFESEDYLELDYDEPGKKSALKTIVLVVVLIVLTVAAGFYFLNDQMAKEQPNEQDKQKSMAVASSLTTEKPEVAKKESQQKSAESTTSDQQANFASLKYQMDESSQSEKQSSVNKKTEKVNISPASENKTYSLVLGSFKVESNADNYRQDLRSRGLEVVKFQGRNDFYLVGFDQIKSKSEAIRLLAEVKEENPNAWITNKD